jgi:hypothetical protein
MAVFCVNMAVKSTLSWLRIESIFHFAQHDVASQRLAARIHVILTVGKNLNVWATRINVLPTRCFASFSMTVNRQRRAGSRFW